jgi:hypothetical protein
VLVAACAKARSRACGPPTRPPRSEVEGIFGRNLRGAGRSGYCLVTRHRPLRATGVRSDAGWGRGLGAASVRVRHRSGSTSTGQRARLRGGFGRNATRAACGCLRNMGLSSIVRGMPSPHISRGETCRHNDPVRRTHPKSPPRTGSCTDTRTGVRPGSHAPAVHTLSPPLLRAVRGRVTGGVYRSRVPGAPVSWKGTNGSAQQVSWVVRPSGRWMRTIRCRSCARPSGGFRQVVGDDAARSCGYRPLANYVLNRGCLSQ